MMINKRLIKTVCNKGNLTFASYSSIAYQNSYATAFSMKEQNLSTSWQPKAGFPNPSSIATNPNRTIYRTNSTLISKILSKRYFIFLYHSIHLLLILHRQKQSSNIGTSSCTLALSVSFCGQTSASGPKTFLWISAGSSGLSARAQSFCRSTS